MRKSGVGGEGEIVRGECGERSRVTVRGKVESEGETERGMG